jgi:RimJ/RimL family protein N-acetyltransferase
MGNATITGRRGTLVQLGNSRRQDDDRAVGVAQATVREGRALVAWVIATKWQRRGYAKLTAQRLVSWLAHEQRMELFAHIHPENVAFEAVARTAGFTPTGDVVEGERVWSFRPVPDVSRVHYRMNGSDAS